MSSSKVNNKTIYNPKTLTYHRTTEQRLIKQQRNHNISSLLPIGLGVLYAWEWKFAYFNSVQEEKENSPNWYHFIYAGITMQITPKDRLNEHLMGPERVETSPKVKNKNLYVALNDALYNKNKTGPHGTRTLTKSILEQNVFKVIDVVSLFDLGLAEEGIIKNNKLQNSSQSNGVDIKSIYESGNKDAKNNIIGLNQETSSGKAGGEGEPIKQSRAPLEWLYAAYYAATESESKEHIREGRKISRYHQAFQGSSVKEKMINILYEHSVGERAISQAFDQSARIKTKEQFEVAVELFLSFLGANTEKVGFDLDTEGNVIVASKFSKTKGINRGEEISNTISGQGIIPKSKIAKTSQRAQLADDILKQIKSKPDKLVFEINTDITDVLTEREIEEIRDIINSSNGIIEEISLNWIAKKISEKT